MPKANTTTVLLPESETKAMQFKLLNLDDPRMPAEWKAAVEADPDQNTLVGYASEFRSTPDLGGDIVLKGAYLKTILERVATGKVPLTDGHGYDGESIMGLVTDAREDDHGLLVKAKWSTAASAQDVKTKVLEGSIWGMSIGYNCIRCEWKQWDLPGEWQGYCVRLLMEVRLNEVAVTAFPMDEGAVILATKSAPFAALPLAPEATPWDPMAAAARVVAWAHSERAMSAKQARAYLGVDLKSGTFVYQFADVVDGELKAVPRAIRLLGAAAVDPETREGIEPLLTHLQKCYMLLGETAPWQHASLDVALAKADAGIVDKAALAAGAKRIAQMLGSEGDAGKTAGPAQPPTGETADDTEAKATALRLRLSRARVEMAKTP